MHQGRTQLSKVFLALTTVGICISIYALMLHLKLKINSGAALSCDINDVASCSKIIGSRYGELFTIPLGALGISFFSIVLAITLLPLYAAVKPKMLAALHLFTAAVGLVVALSAAYIAYVILEGVCMVCSSIQLLCLIYFIYAVIVYHKERDKPLDFDLVVLKRLVLMGGVLGLTPILAGALTQKVALSLFKTESGSSPMNIDKAAVSEEKAHFSRGKEGQAEDFRKGSENAPLVLVEFTDFECPYCQKLHELLQQVQADLGPENLLIVFRNWPIKYHRHAFELAVAARCAGLQGKFWEFTDDIYETAQKLGNDADGKERMFNRNAVMERAAALGYDKEKFTACLDNQEVRNKITRDAEEAQQLGGKGTPFILINGTPYTSNWLQEDKLKQDLKQMLESR
jgi:protein-disulfide isomerase/uncharacterized membrane protein